MPSTPSLTPRPRQISHRHLTDASSFRIVDEHTATLETVISSARRNRADQVQEWVNEINPGPIDILRKIAQVSQPHRHILTLICDELSQFSDTSMEDPLVELNNDAADQYQIFKAKIAQMEKRMQQRRADEEILKEEIQQAEQDLEEAQQEHQRFQHLLEVNTFYEQKRREADAQAAFEMASMSSRKLLSAKSNNEASHYNQTWGENTHLRNEISRLQKKIDEQREFHLDHAHRFAKTALSTQKIQEVAPVEPEFLTLEKINAKLA